MSALADEKSYVDVVDTFFKWFAQEWPTLFPQRRTVEFVDAILKNLPRGDEFVANASVGRINASKISKNPEYVEVFISPRCNDEEIYKLSRVMCREYNRVRCGAPYDNVTMIFDIAPIPSPITDKFNSYVVFVPYFNREKHPEIKVLLFLGVIDSQATPTPTNNAFLEEYTTNDVELKDARMLYGQSWTPAEDDVRISQLINCIGHVKYREHTKVLFINGNAFGAVTPVTNIRTYFEKLEKIKKKCTYCARSEMYVQHLSCGKCKKMLYCSKMCQINDYSRHSMTCE